VGRFPLVVALVTVLAGCQVASSPLAAPIASPSPHTSVAAAALQASDVPADLHPCPASGPIATYLTTIKASNPTLAQRLSAQWLALKKSGAQDAAITLFAADSSACSAELASTATVRSGASIVVVFADEGQADRAWQAGILGFAPPPPGAIPPGVARGKGTGLGDSSWTYRKAPVFVASWRKSVFVALLVATNLDDAAFKAAAAAIDARLN
jgi:hypothetical protein